MRAAYAPPRKSVLPVEEGGTNAKTAADARTNLGLGDAATYDLASQAEAEAGTANDKLVSPLRVAQRITAIIASQAEAEANTDNTKIMTSLRVYQQQTNRIASQAEAEAGSDTVKLMTPERTAQAITALAPSGGGAHAVVTSLSELTAAAAASERAIYIKGFITLTADLNLSQHTRLMIAPGYAFNTDSYSIIMASSKDLELCSNGTYATENFYWTKTGAGNPVSLSATREFYLHDIKVRNYSTSASTHICTSTAKVVVRNVYCQVPNYAQAGILSSAGNCRVNQLTVYGGGASSSGALYLSGISSQSSDLFVEDGTWSTTQGAIYISSSTDGSISNVIAHYGCVLSLSAGTLSGVAQENNAGKLFLSAPTNGRMHASNIRIIGYTSTGEISLDDDVFLTNFECQTLTLATAQRCRFTNGYVEDAFTTSGEHFNTFVSVTFAGGVSEGSSDNTYIGCRAGSTAGGGSETIAVGAGATRATVSLCQTDSAVTDAGASSNIANNTVF